jgi:hypothetical protein
MQNCGEDAKLRERTHSGRLQHTACAGAIAVKHSAETTANRYVRTPTPTATTANIKLASSWLPFEKEPCDIPKPIAQGSSSNLHSDGNGRVRWASHRRGCVQERSRRCGHGNDQHREPQCEVRYREAYARQPFDYGCLQREGKLRRQRFANAEAGGEKVTPAKAGLNPDSQSDSQSCLR